MAAWCAHSVLLRVWTDVSFCTSPLPADHGCCSSRLMCLVEAIEEIARALKLEKLMLCSTNDPIVKSTWHHLNFDFASEEEMEAWDIPHADLVYLQNTTQSVSAKECSKHFWSSACCWLGSSCCLQVPTMMHKVLPPPGQYRPIVIKHKDFKQRTYARLDPVVKRPSILCIPFEKSALQELRKDTCNQDLARAASVALTFAEYPFLAHERIQNACAPTFNTPNL
eukprot:scaffold59309_cov17-Tisochrysis_lutea.AAC.2